MVFGLKLAVCQRVKGQQSLSQPDSESKWKYLSCVATEPQTVPQSDNFVCQQQPVDAGFRKPHGTNTENLACMVDSFKIKL